MKGLLVALHPVLFSAIAARNSYLQAHRSSATSTPSPRRWRERVLVRKYYAQTSEFRAAQKRSSPGKQYSSTCKARRWTKPSSRRRTVAFAKAAPFIDARSVPRPQHWNKVSDATAQAGRRRDRARKRRVLIGYAGAHTHISSTSPCETCGVEGRKVLVQGAHLERTFKAPAWAT